MTRHRRPRAQTRGNNDTNAFTRTHAHARALGPAPWQPEPATNRALPATRHSGLPLRQAEPPSRGSVFPAPRRAFATRCGPRMSKARGTSAPEVSSWWWSLRKPLASSAALLIVSAAVSCSVVRCRRRWTVRNVPRPWSPSPTAGRRSHRHCLPSSFFFPSSSRLPLLRPTTLMCR